MKDFNFTCLVGSRSTNFVNTRWDYELVITEILFTSFQMDNTRKKRKGKVGPTGEENSSFELDMRSDIQNNR